MKSFWGGWNRSEEHTSELQSPCNLVCRLLLEKKTPQRLPRAKAQAPPAEAILPLSETRRQRHADIRRGKLRGLEQGVGANNDLAFFFNDTATTEIYTLSLHDALPISVRHGVTAAARTDRADVVATRDVD